MSIKFIIQQNKKSRKDPKATFGIYLRITKGKVVDIKARTVYDVCPSDWNNKEGKVRSKSNKSLLELQSRLDELKGIVSARFTNDYLKSKTIDTFWLKDILNPIKKQEKTHSSFMDYLESYRDDVSVNRTESVAQKVNQALNRIPRYEKDRKRTLSISDISPNILADMENYFLKKEIYSIGTVKRFIKFIKTVCYYAQKNGAIINTDIRQYKVKIPESQPIYLNKEEIIKIKELELKQNYLDNARDWLIISCFTAQRVSDLMKNTIQNVKSQSNGVRYLNYRQKKTGALVEIPILKPVEDILAKYGNNFPRRISHDKYNDYIKEVCKKADINELITGEKQITHSAKKLRIVNPRERRRKISGEFPKYELVTGHIGRRSFASNFTGVLQIALVMRFTGHKSEKQLEKYIGRTTESYRPLFERHFFSDRVDDNKIDEYWGF